MVNNARTREEKLFYLGQQMEQFRGTFFRQTMFAEFELRIHDMAEAGEGLSGERFTALYLELLRKYHGAGMQIDPLYAIEWAYHPALLPDLLRLPIRHLGLGRGLLLAERAERRARRSASAISTRCGPAAPTIRPRSCSRAGLDMTTPAPYRALIAEFGRVLDEAERLLAQQG